MAMLILAATGPRAEELAMAAGDETGIPVGFDPDLESATFDADAMDEQELQSTVFAALDELDPDWQSHLELAE
jgi:hypothetical protein